MTKSRKLKTFATLVVLLAGMLLTFVPRIQVHASVPPSYSYPTPWWWTFSDSSHKHCDSGHYGNSYTLKSTWNGLEACGPATTTTETFPPSNIQNQATEQEWQCTELAARYLFIAYGAPPIAADGNQIVDNYTSTYGDLFTKVANNGTNHVKVGDVLSYYSPDDHTAIVIDTSNVNGSTGNGTITVLQQNTADTNGQSTQTVSGWVIKHGVDDGGTTDTVQYWLTPNNTRSWSDVSPSGTTYDTIYSMAASSTTNIWAAGIEKGSSARMPVTYHNTGSGWTKYLPSPQSYTSHHALNGIATSSSSDAWTVGQYAGSNSQLTLAYHWTGSSWGNAVTSDNPAPDGNDNVLNGVAYAGTDVFAVGYYHTSSGNQPLVEKYVTSPSTKLAQQTIASLPSGCTTGQLNSVSFSSSTNGWAVGKAYCSPNTVWLVYHYDGTNWNVTVSSTASQLNSVTAVSDNEAWAVGTKGTYPSTSPYILHYTAANGWAEDTSFSSSYYPTSASLNSIGSDSSTDVWIVGAYSNGTIIVPYTMHWNGYVWVISGSPTPSSSVTVTGVAVNSGNAWLGGYTGVYYSTPSPLAYQYS